jgi:hypothetical protein
VKQKNSFILFLSLTFVLILSSCNQEEGKFVLSQYNYSYTQSYKIINNNSMDESEEQSLSVYDFNDSEYISTQQSLSYGASFTKDSVKINQLKISNDVFNWTLNPNIFEDNGTKYFGAKNLIIPNVNMLSDGLRCEIYLEDGTIVNDTIPVENVIFTPLKVKLSILNDYVLLEDISDSSSNDNRSYKTLTLDSLKSNDLELVPFNSNSNFIIRFYKENKLLYEKELNLMFDDNYYLFQSQYVSKCDTIYIAKKNSNNSLSSNLYSIEN